MGKGGEEGWVLLKLPQEKLPAQDTFAACKQCWQWDAEPTEARAAARPGSSWAVFSWPLCSADCKAFSGIKHLPDHGGHGGTGSCSPGQVPASLLHWAGSCLGKTRMFVAPGEREGGANTCGCCCCCCSRDVLTSERNLLYPHRVWKENKTYNLKPAPGPADPLHHHCSQVSIPRLWAPLVVEVDPQKSNQGSDPLCSPRSDCLFSYPLPPARCAHCLSPASLCVHPGVHSAIQFRKLIQLKSSARKKKKFPTRI